MSDWTLLDLAEITPFEAGMAASQASANTRWTPAQIAAVDEAIRLCAYFSPTFTADDVWRRLGPDFPVTKGMAARLTAASNRGIIINTGLTAFASRGGDHDHRQRLTVWAPR